MLSLDRKAEILKNKAFPTVSEYSYCTHINSLSSLADSRSKNAAASKF